jgi:Flp pilus assembly protein TadB
MSNKALYLVSSVAVLVITVVLLKATYISNLWREFVISEFIVVFTTVALIGLFKNKDQIKK